MLLRPDHGTPALAKSREAAHLRPLAALYKPLRFYGNLPRIYGRCRGCRKTENLRHGSVVVHRPHIAGKIWRSSIRHAIATCLEAWGRQRRRSVEATDGR